MIDSPAVDPACWNSTYNSASVEVLLRVGHCVCGNAKRTSSCDPESCNSQRK